MIVYKFQIYVFVTFSALALVASLVWLAYSILKISKSIDVLKKYDEAKDTDIQSEIVDMAEAIRYYSGKVDLVNFKALPYAELSSIESKTTNLWCRLARDIYTDVESFVYWLYYRNSDLDGNQPIELLSTEIGYQRVYMLLGKTAAGIPV